MAGSTEVNHTLYDVTIVGGGILGLATGLALTARNPALRLLLLEKEPRVGMHQTGHNSGVIHAGIYYRPGSLKARLSVQGVQRMMAFCDAHDIPYEKCGKVIVATDERELVALDELYRRGSANGVPDLRKIDATELRAIEPHAAGLAALHSPHTAILEYRLVAQAMSDDLQAYHGEIRCGASMLGADLTDTHVRIHTSEGPVLSRSLLNCAGLYADRIARSMGVQTDMQIVPFRGEYYHLRPHRRGLVRGLIYPVPDPDLPFLGVHFTKTIDGGVEAGPNAVLAFAREGYRKRTVVPADLIETLTYPGFLALARRYWRTGAYEVYRSLSTRAFVRSLQRLVPAIRAADVIPGGAGVRAQAIAADGRLLDDFHIVESPRAVHVLNAPSPGATASLAIGDHIADRALGSLCLRA